LHDDSSLGGAGEHEKVLESTVCGDKLLRRVFGRYD
jgi:hypothetical protein